MNCKNPDEFGRLRILEKIELECFGLSEKPAKVENPLLIRSQSDRDNPALHILRIMRNPDNFYFTCKMLMNSQNGKPLRLFPYQAVILREMWYRPFPMLVASRGAGKSFLLGLYALLRALFIQGRRIVITGSGFRQAKTVFSYIETIWWNSPILRSLVAENVNSGPHHGSDRWEMIIGESKITALPVGDGCLSPYTAITCNDKFSFISSPSRQVWGHGKFREIDERYENGLQPTKIVTTAKGYSFESTYNHRMKILRHGIIQWVRADEMVLGDRILIDRSIRWHSGQEPITEDEAWEMGTCYTKDKYFPSPILRASRESVSAFISGLFDTDGYVQGGTSITVGFTNTSEALVDQLQFILLHYGIIARKGWRDRDPEIFITGPDVKRFHEQIGFRLKRKRDALSAALSNKIRNYGHGDTIPGVQAEMLAIARKYRIRKGQATSETTSVSGGRIQRLRGVTHRLAHVFCRVYGPLVQTDDEKHFIDRLNNLANPDIFYDEIISIDEGRCDTFDIHVPEGHEYCANGFFSHNSKIRGERANDVIADEFASISRDIFEIVIAGFGVVELDPWDRVEQEAKIRILKQEELWTVSMEEEMRKTRVGNQTIISGTAFYQFNHFADYWKLWKGIILSKGDRRTLDMLFPNGIDQNFDWRDFSIIRLPVELLPPGYMDARQVARSKATQHSGTFLNEFGAVFSSDSNGFFKRSLVESCVTNEPIIVEGMPVQFKATTKGNLNMKYIFGVDPASEVDKFSIVIIEVHDTHRRVVYCWTTTSEAHRQRLRARATQEADFYAYCARKIRDLMKVFPCEVISMDAMGGGIAVAEALHDSDKLYPGEKVIWPITMDHSLSDGKERDSDAYSGLHIIEMVNFAKFEYTADANHGMRKDFEDKVLLFPQYDTGLLALAMEDDNLHQRVYDTLEDCVQEIEELKEELATIVHTQTPNTNRDRWDTPEIKIAGSKKGRLRKDRYSALLMANAAARRLARHHEGPAYEPLGGWVGQISTNTGDEMYIHVPEWWQKGVQTNMDGYGWVHRGSGVRDDSLIGMQSNLYPLDM